MFNKTIKMAGMSAVMVASVGSFAFLTTPDVARATNLCNANPTMEDFSAAYVEGSVTSAHVAHTGEMPMCEGVSQVFSLNAYTNEGGTWETSGTQKLVDHATVTLGGEKTEADLSVKLPEGDCYFQTDLYANATRYDGVDGPLPHYPETEAPLDFIDARSGGNDVCVGGNGGGEVLGDVTELPKTGGGLTGMIALSAGLLGASASFLRARRTR
jgi:hypothetical protein